MIDHNTLTPSRLASAARLTEKHLERMEAFAAAAALGEKSPQEIAQDLEVEIATYCHQVRNMFTEKGVGK